MRVLRGRCTGAADLGDTALPPGVSAEELREACRALRGRVLRQEIYAHDGSPASVHPYSTTEHRYEVDLLQPPVGTTYGAFYAWELENIACHYEREPTDPQDRSRAHARDRRLRKCNSKCDGRLPRRSPTFPEQSVTSVLYSEADYINVADQSDFYRIGLPAETRSYELTGVSPPPLGQVLRS